MPAIQRPVSWTVWTSWTRNRSSPSADWSAWRPSLGGWKAALHNCLPITERSAVPHTHQHVMIAALPETITVGPDIRALYGFTNAGCTRSDDSPPPFKNPYTPPARHF